MGVHPFEASVLGFERRESFYFTDAHASVLGFSIVVRRVADTDLSAEVDDPFTLLVTYKDRDDLGFAESGFVHGSKVYRWTTERDLIRSNSKGCLCF